MSNPSESRIDWQDPGGGLIIAGVAALMGDAIYLISAFTIIFFPLGLFVHYIAGVMIGATLWSKLRTPKPKPGTKQDLNKMTDELINRVINPKIALVIAIVLPLPLLFIGTLVAILLQNTIVKMLVDIAVKLVVVGAVTGGAGAVAEGGAALAEAGEAAAGAAEASAAAAEATAGAAEASAGAAETAGAAGEAGEGAAKAGQESFANRFKEEAKKSLRERAGQGGGQGDEEEEGDETDQPAPSAEEQERMDEVSGNHIERLLREYGAEGIFSNIGQAANDNNAGEQPTPFARPRPLEARQPRSRSRQNDARYNKEVNLKEAQRQQDAEAA